MAEPNNILPFVRRRNRAPKRSRLWKAWVVPVGFLAIAAGQYILGDGSVPAPIPGRHAAPMQAKAGGPQVIEGTASVIDGDTIEVHGTRIRFHGIDAPESSQLCRDATGNEYRAGQKAALALSGKIGRRPVSCTRRDSDRYGRTVAICKVGGEDVNAWMVRQGWAMAYRQYSGDYVAAEAEARSSHAGIWRGECEPPWEWRRLNPRD